GRHFPAAPVSAYRGSFVFPGRRRSVAVAPLRPDRAARPLRRRELSEPAETLPPLSGRTGVAERKVGAWAFPPVHPVRRGHRRCLVGCDRRRALHARRRYAGEARSWGPLWCEG